MITDLLVGLLIAAVIALAALAVWVIREREPAGHGRHGARRTTIVDLPYLADGSYSSALEVHHDVPWPHTEVELEPSDAAREVASWAASPVGAPARAGHHRDWTPRPLTPARDLAPWIAKALASAKVDETVIDVNHGTFASWLENVVGGDPWDGKGSKDAYHAWLFAGMRGAL